MLRLQRADPHRQLVRMVLVGAGILANPVEPFAQGVTLRQQGFPALGVQRHAIQRFLQGQARLAQLLLFQRALLGQFRHFFVETAATQYQLLDLGLLRGQLRLQLAVPAPLLLDLAPHLLARAFQLALLVAGRSQTLLAFGDTGFQGLPPLLQRLQFLGAGEHAALGLVAAPDPQEVPADPVAIATDQALAVVQGAALGERLFQGLHRFHPGQPGTQVGVGADLVQQRTGRRRGSASGAEQAQLALAEAGQGEPVEAVQQDRLQIRAEHGLHRQLPTRLDTQAFGEARTLFQALLAQPLQGALSGIESGLLQGLQRSDAPVQALQLALRLVLFGGQLLQFLAQLFESLGLALLLQLQFFQGQFGDRHLFVEFEDRRVLGVGRQLATLLLQAPLAILQALQALLQVLDARLLHLGLAAGFGALLVEGIPLLLPGLHALLGLFQGDARFFRGGRAEFLFRCEHGHFLGQGREQGTVMPEVRFGFLAGPFGFAQVVLQLALALLAMLDALLDPGDVAADRIEARLHLVEAFGQLVMAVAQPFDAGIGTALLGHQGLEGDLLVADDPLALTDLLVQVAPAHGTQLGLELALLGLVFLVFFRRLGLPVQAFQLPPQLFAQVGEACQVFLGPTDAAFGFAAALLVLGNARGFLDEVAQVFRTRLDQLGDHALFDDRVAARPQAGAEEDVGDVAPPALGAVEEIGVLPVPRDPPANGYLGVLGVFAHQGGLGVVEDQLDARLAHRLAGIRAVEDDVGHRLAAQVLRRAFAHHPAHRVDDVRLAAAVRPYHRRHVAGEVHRGRIDEGLEPRQLDALQAHACAPARVAISVRRARPAPAGSCGGRIPAGPRGSSPRHGRSPLAGAGRNCRGTGSFPPCAAPAPGGRRDSPPAAGFRRSPAGRDCSRKERPRA
ncbi:Uncharacterised protein [Acinetobacter baumannii]|nr:Uncharacterised protein [Acinetobacter baumannii]